MEKELNSIQSEFELNFDTDLHKKIHVARETCDPSHNYAKFNVGNKKTLKEDPEAKGINVRERLLEFYEKHYSANVMSLCVLGKASLDELYTMITERLPFNEIKNKKINLKLRSELLAKSAFQKEHLAKEIKIVPNKETHQLTIDFKPNELYKSLNRKDRLYAIAAEDYIANVFNQKGEGSILAELKDRRGLVSSIILFANSVVATLPKESVAEEKVDEIIKTIFQYFNFVKKDGIQRWIFDEKCTISEIAYNHKEKEDPLTKVLTIALKMQIFKIENAVQCACGSNREFRPEFIEQLLDHLKPENMRITLMSKAFEGKTDRKEKYYGVNYSYQDISKERIARWTDVDFNENLKLHQPNEYIPSNLELVDREKVQQKVPQLIKKDAFSHVWFLQDNQFKTPRAFYGVHLKNPFLNLDSAAVTLMTIYCRLLNESLKEYSSQAAQAGILYLVTVTHDGLLIEVDGYNEKLPIILGKIMDKLVKFEFSRERFEKFKESDQRFWKNYYQQPLSVLLSTFQNFLLLEQSSVEDILASMHLVTFEELESVSKRFFSRLFINLFVHGNVTRRDAELVESMTKQRLIDVYRTSTVLKSAFRMRRAVKLGDHASYIYQHNSKEHHQNGILLFYEIGPESPAEIAKVDLLITILSEKFYHHLRTEEQLGYSVHMGAASSVSIQGFSFYIVSTYAPQHLDDRIEQFIEWAADYLNNKLSDEDFNLYKKSLKLAYSEPIKMLYSQSVNYWFQIIDDMRAFSKSELKLKAAEELTKEQIVSLFNEHLIRNKRKLSIRIVGEKKITKEAKAGQHPAMGDLIGGLPGATLESNNTGMLDLIGEMLGAIKMDAGSKDEQSKSEPIAAEAKDEALKSKPNVIEQDAKADEPKAVESGGNSETNEPQDDLANVKTRKVRLMILWIF